MRRRADGVPIAPPAYWEPAAYSEGGPGTLTPAARPHTVPRYRRAAHPHKKILRRRAGVEQESMNHHERSPHCNPRAGGTPGQPHGPIEAARAPPARHQVFVRALAAITTHARA